MPDLTAINLGANQFAFTGFISFVPSVVVFEALVNQTAFNNTTLTITFDTVTVGAFGDVKFGQKIIVYSGSTSAVKAVLYVAPGAATSTVMQVNEFSYGDLVIQNNDKLQVISVWDPREALVSNTVDFLKYSRTSAGTYPSDPPPVCNSGGPVAGKIDTGTSLLTASHYGDTSWRVDPDAGSITHAWAFGSGATPTTSTSANPAGVTYPEGFRWISHTITDSNGRTTTQYVKVHAHGATYIPLPVQMTSHNANLDQGYHTIEFTVPRAYATLVTTLMDRCPITYWELEDRAGTTISYGSNVTGRSHIKFDGYLDSRSISINADGDTLTFTAIGSLGIAGQLGALSQVVKSGTTSKWTYLKTLTVWRMLWSLLNWGSTLQLVHDFIMADGDPYLYSQLTIDNISSIQGQLDDLSASICVKATSDQLSRILLTRTLPFLTVAERAARTKTLDFTTALSVTVEWSEPMRPGTKLVTIDAITTGSTVATQTDVYGWAPGDAPGEGTDTSSLPKQIVTTTTQAYQRVGDEYARLNGRYYDETTKAIRRVPMGLRLTVIGAADVIDPMLLEPVSITLPASTNTLGLSFASTELWIVTDVSISYDADAGIKTVVLTCDHETHGPTGKSRPDPNQSSTGVDPSLTIPGDFNPGGGTLIPIYTPPVTPSGTLPLKYVMIDWQSNKIARCTSYDLSTGGVWALCDSTLIVTGNYHDICADPYNYARYFVVTSTGLWRCDNIWTTPDAWTLVASESTISGTAGLDIHKINMSINRRGYILVRFGSSSISYSFDYGALWTKRNGFTGAIDTTADILYSRGPALSANNNPGSTNQGWAYMNSNGTPGHLYQTKNWGDTWTSIASLSFSSDGRGYCHIPYKRGGGGDNTNDSSQIVFVYGLSTLLSVTAAGVVTALDGATPVFRRGNSGTFNDGRYMLNSYTFDGNKLAAVSNGSGSTPAFPRFYTSVNGGSTWTDHGSYTVVGNNQVVGVNGWSSDPNIFVVWGNQHIVITFDGGVTLIELTGNLGSIIGASFQPRVVLPDLSDFIPAS